MTVLSAPSPRAESEVEFTNVDESLDEEEVDIVGSGDEGFSDESDDEELTKRKARQSRYDVAFIFELLWRTRKSPQGAGIWLPETVVFRHSHPTGWYFTNHDGRIMKRNNGQEHFISQKKILEVFDGATGEVTAIFVNTHDLDGKRVAGNVQYFDRRHLREFLYTEDPNRNGFLQKFVSVKQQQYSNASLQTLHVNWTRGVLRSTNVESRTNILKVTRRDAEKEQHRFSYARAELRSSVQLPVQSHLLVKIHECCERLVAHVSAVTEGRVSIDHLIAYFRVGHQGRIWLNFCSSVDVQSAAAEAEALVMSPPARLKGARMAAAALAGMASGGHSHHPGASASASPRKAPLGLGPGDSDHPPLHAHGQDSNSRASESDEEGEGTRAGGGGEAACTLCEGEDGEGKGGRVSYATLMGALRAWHVRNERGSKELHRPYSVGDTVLYPQSPHEQSKVVSLWRSMSLRDADEVSLPQLLEMLLALGLQQASVDELEVAIAAADTALSGFIGFRLFSKGVAAAWADGLPEDVRAVFPPPLAPSAHPLAATADRGAARLPLIEHCLQRAVNRKDYIRLLPPASADRENGVWVQRSIPACSQCCVSLSNLAKDPSLAYWDDQLDVLFAQVSPDRPIPAHYALPAAFAYTHAPVPPVGEAAHQTPRAGRDTRRAAGKEASSESLQSMSRAKVAGKAPPNYSMTRLEREWIRKRRAGELPRSREERSAGTGGVGGAGGLGASGTQGPVPSVSRSRGSMTGTVGERSWGSPGVGSPRSPRSQVEAYPPDAGGGGGGSPHASALSDADLVAEVQRRNLWKGPLGGGGGEGDGGDAVWDEGGKPRPGRAVELGPPLMVIRSDAEPKSGPVTPFTGGGGGEGGRS